MTRGRFWLCCAIRLGVEGSASRKERLQSFRYYYYVAAAPTTRKGGTEYNRGSQVGTALSNEARRGLAWLAGWRPITLERD